MSSSYAYMMQQFTMHALDVDNTAAKTLTASAKELVSTTTSLMSANARVRNQVLLEPDLVPELSALEAMTGKLKQTKPRDSEPFTKQCEQLAEKVKKYSELKINIDKEQAAAQVTLLQSFKDIFARVQAAKNPGEMARSQDILNEINKHKTTIKKLTADLNSLTTQGKTTRIDLKKQENDVTVALTGRKPTPREQQLEAISKRPE